MKKELVKKANYEVMLVVKPYLPDNIRNEVYKSVEGFVRKNNGSVLLRDIWGKRYLAYRTDRHKEGYYVVYQINLTVNVISDMEKLLSRQSDVLRYGIFAISTGEIGQRFGKKSLEA